MKECHCEGHKHASAHSEWGSALRIFEKALPDITAGWIRRRKRSWTLSGRCGVCEALGHGISGFKEGERGTTVMITLQCEKCSRGDLVNM